MRSVEHHALAKCIYCLVLALVCSNSYPQSQISFRQLSVKEGLSQNSAVAIAQDSTGYLWIATQDGLNKYDGREFTLFPFRFVDITKSNYSNLGKVYTDRQGRIWIIPITRIPYKYDAKKNEFRSIANIDDASVIYQSKDSTLWIGTYSKGLYALPKGRLNPKVFIPPSKLPGTVFNITETHNGDLLLSLEQTIIQVDPRNGKAINTVPLSFDGDEIVQNFSDIEIDKTNRQWIGTFGDGLYFKDQSTNFLQRISDLSYTDPLPVNLNILDLYIDTKDRLWIATYGSGLYMIDFSKQKIDHFNVDKHNPRAIHYKDVLCIYEDYSGTMWFGTDGGGISYYDEFLEKFNSFTNYQTPESISIDVVRAIAVDKKEAVWIGTSGKGLTQYEPETNSWRTFRKDATQKNGITSNRIMSLFVNDGNEIWIGTQDGGLNIYDQKQFAYFGPESDTSLSATTIWTIFKDSQDRIWLGTRENGLIEFDKSKGEVRKYQTKPNSKKGPPSNNIRVITEDTAGNLWIGTEEDGITYFNVSKQTFKTYTSSEEEGALSNNNIKSLYYDHQGILWIGTNGGGLNALHIGSGRFYNYTSANGLANNVIYSILPDDQGQLWLSSNKGITRFVPGKTLEELPDIKNYNNYDGLATEFNTGAHYKDGEGNLYFGGLEGFYWFKPEELKDNSFLPKTAITAIEVSNQPYPIGDDMRLNHDQNTISFSFSSLQYSLPEKNNYQYQLVNYDDDWVHAGNTNFARYSFLPYGDYEFQVRSSNYDGLWNPVPARLKFTITAPWYLTSIAKFVYALLFIAAVYGVYAYLKWRWRLRMNLQLKEDETIRLKKLNDFKSKLYTDISHEFRTPLTLIAGPVEAKLSEGRLSDADFANFSMIKRNTNRLMNLVEQLLHLAKLEKGKMQLKIFEGNLQLFLGALTSSFRYAAEQKGIDYKVNIATMGPTLYDEDALEKIMTNLISNAIKYCPSGGVCSVEVLKAGGRIQLEVRNTFEELSEVDIENLFTRFYQKDEYTEGAGVGLSLVKELVHLYRGEIVVKVEQANIILFKVCLPAERTFFKEDQIIDKHINTPLESDAKFTDSIDIDPGRDVGKEEQEPPIILIVEDHSEVREFLKSVWKHRYQIFLAENGRDGIGKALEIIPDLIITDVRMPICDGITLCNELKADERTSHIPIILLTAGLGEEDELKGLQSGADDFITKPFKLRILDKRVENLMETRKALRSRYSQEVILKAKDIAITPTDEVFINRMQKVLDKHLADPGFNAAGFCKELGMSRMQLHRKLLAFTGLSTTAFIRSQRLKQALHILQTSDASVSEVAYTVGFNTPSYFIKCFKETYKKTPSEYLQSSDIH